MEEREKERQWKKDKKGRKGKAHRGKEGKLEEHEMERWRQQGEGETEE